MKIKTGFAIVLTVTSFAFLMTRISFADDWDTSTSGQITTLYSNTSVGIGVAEPQQSLHVNGSLLMDSGLGGNNINYTYGSRAYRYTFEGGGYNLLLKGKDSCPIFGVDRINGSVDNPQPLADNDDIVVMRSSGTNASGTQTFHRLLRARVDGNPAGETALDQKLGLLDDKVMIRSSGNVGIGTTDPEEKLEVTGNIKVNGNIVSDGDICIGNCD